MKRFLAVLLSILMVFPSILASPVSAAFVDDESEVTRVIPESDWFDAAWQYRKAIAVTGSSAPLADFQVRVPVDWVPGRMNSDFSDIRFTAADGTTLLSHWRESFTPSDSVVFWVKVPSIPTAGTTVYIYYGNSSATSASDGEATFIFFDDFSGVLLDSEKWAINQFGTPWGPEGASYSVSGGRLSLVSGYAGSMSLRSNFVSGDNSRLVISGGTTSGGFIGQPYLRIGQFSNLGDPWPLGGVFWQSHPDSGPNGVFHTGDGVSLPDPYSRINVPVNWAGPHDWVLTQLPDRAEGFVDGELRASITTTLYHEPSPIRLDANQYASTPTTLSVDTVFVTKYAATQPVATVGPEQTSLGPIYNSRTLEVFDTIQAAIDDTDTRFGDTIIINPGTYYENVDVTKSVTIRSASGNPLDTTVIAAQPTDHVFDVSVDEVTIDGLRIYGTASGSDKASVRIGYVSHDTVRNNIIGAINASDYGILLEGSGAVNIEQNEFKGNRTALEIQGGSRNDIIGNSFVYSELYDIYVTYRGSLSNTSNDNYIIGNNFGEGEATGLYLSYSSKNTISGNLIEYKVGRNGIELYNSSENSVSRNVIRGIALASGIKINGSSNDNVFFLNSIYGNTTNASVTSGANFWNSNTLQSYQFEDAQGASHAFRRLVGNYWGDYTGSDTNGDGIGETPRPVTTDRSDLYPLTEDIDSYMSATVQRLIVSSTDGGDVSAPGEGEFFYVAGTSVDLTAVADPGHAFVNWAGDVSNVLYVNDPTTTITMDADYVISANFTDPVVTFPDANLEAAIRLALPKTSGDIYRSELETLTSLDASLRMITNLSGLEYCTGLTSLQLQENQITDVAPLAGLTSLTELLIWGNQISNIAPLSGLTNLTTLSIGANQISNIGPLAGLTGLTTLGLDNNQISDISVLAGLTSLQTLSLYNNQISNINALSGLVQINVLSISDNLVTDISPLVANSGLASGDNLWVNYNLLDISDGSEDMLKIQELIARGVSVIYSPQNARTFTLHMATFGTGTTDPAAGSWTYAQGETVTVTAIAGEGWVFSHWAGDVTSRQNPIEITMDSSKAVTAYFTPEGTALIAAIKIAPSEFEGKWVTVHGQYRGWEVGHGSAPVSRSDWVLQGNTGSIYVTGDTMGFRHPQSLGYTAIVTGSVRLKDGIPYIEVPRRQTR